MTRMEKKRALTPHHLEEASKIFAELERILYSGQYVKAWPPNPCAKVVEWMRVVWAGPINCRAERWEPRPCPNLSTYWSS